MKRLFAVFSFLLICVALTTGCVTNNDNLIKENEQLKHEIAVLKQEISYINAHNEETLVLRNALDEKLHNILAALVEADYEAVREDIAGAEVINKRVIFDLDGKKNEFLIPERQMNLRQSFFVYNEEEYAATYEVYDSGYNTKNKKFKTLDVYFVKEEGKWKLSNLQIN